MLKRLCLPQYSVLAISCPSLGGKFSNMLSFQQNSINNLNGYKVIHNTKVWKIWRPSAGNQQRLKSSTCPGIPGGLEMTEARLLPMFLYSLWQNPPKSSLEQQIPCLVFVGIWGLPPVFKVKTNPNKQTKKSHWRSSHWEMHFCSHSLKLKLPVTADQHLGGHCGSVGWGPDVRRPSGHLQPSSNLTINT